MDNQQALTMSEKGWLCGFFDGEGNANLNVCQNHSALKSKTTKRHTIIIPRLNVINTDYETIMHWKRLWERVWVGNHIQIRRRNNPKHSPCYAATIQGHKRCKKAIPILLAGCVTKKPILAVMQEWLDHREQHYHYSLKDYELYQKFTKVMNGNGPNDLTLRRLYVSCTSDLSYSEGIKKGWDTRRKVKSNL